MFAAFFHHADTESYATIKRLIDSHVTAYEGGNVRVSQKPGGKTSRVPPTTEGNVRGTCPGVNVLHPSRQWLDELRYLGVHIVRSSQFKISLDKPRRSFYRVANSVFGKVRRVASEEVTIQLFNSKCVPVAL